MKRKIISGMLIIVLLITGMVVKVNAEAPTVTLKLDKSELNPGETFTAVIHINCEDGINGLESTVAFDNNKLELVESKVTDDKWVNLGQTTENEIQIAIMNNSTSKITNADIFALTFKVKESTPRGTKIKINVSNIVVYSDTQEITNLETEECEVSIFETLEIGLQGYTEKGTLTNKYISGIKPKTTMATILANITTNGTIEIYDGETKVTDTNTKIKTGMKIKSKLGNQEQEHSIAVVGDTTGDGESNFSDIMAINVHRLNKGKRLEGIYLDAADVTGDGKADFADIARINLYRLGKIIAL